MADNVTLNPGSGGSVVAADDIGGVYHQRVKVEWGANGSVNEVDDVSGVRLPVKIGWDGNITVQSSQVSATTNTTTTRTTTTGLGDYLDIDLIIKITGGGAATGTLQLFIQDSSDGGTTWDDLIASNTFTFGASTTNQIFKVSGRTATTHPQGTASQTEAMTAGTARQGPWGDRIRVREKVSGVSGSPTGVTYTVLAIFKR
jgi:hypothetical protein